MTRAICIRCGAEKHGCWTRCRDCGHAPFGEVELADSLCLSDQYLDEEDLPAVVEFIQENGKTPVFEAAFNHALQAVRASAKALTKRGLM